MQNFDKRKPDPPQGRAAGLTLPVVRYLDSPQKISMDELGFAEALLKTINFLRSQDPSLREGVGVLIRRTLYGASPPIHSCVSSQLFISPTLREYTIDLLKLATARRPEFPENVAPSLENLINSLKINLKRRYPGCEVMDTVNDRPRQKLPKGYNGDAFPKVGEILHWHDITAEKTLWLKDKSFVYHTTQDGRHVVQQIGHKACTAACAMMLILDNHANVHSIHIEALSARSGSPDSIIVEDLRHAGLKTKHTVINIKSNSPTKLPELKSDQIIEVDSKQQIALVVKDLIDKNGPVAMGLGLKYLGNHELLIDRIDLPEASNKMQGSVTLRDPHHGVSMVISLKAFEESLNCSCHEAIQVVK